jgi:hypothetical protein
MTGKEADTLFGNRLIRMGFRKRIQPRFWREVLGVVLLVENYGLPCSEHRSVKLLHHHLGCY